MRMAEGADSLEYTPTWIVAVVCCIIVAISLIVERLLHYIGKFLKHNQQFALFEALQKLKEELMLLGFISLLLTVFQSLISDMCMPKNFSYHMLPCKRMTNSRPGEEAHYHDSFIGSAWKGRQLLSEGNNSNHCAKQGKVPLLSLEALHHLHIFIFVLAVVHVIFCATTMVLGGLKIRRWKSWENAILHEHSKNKHAETGQVHHPHLAFINERVEGYWMQSATISWVMSFFKQFYASVTKSDYAALRLGFIMKHCKTNPKFDFHKYMMRVLETDFKKVVGITWYLWLFVVVFLLVDIYGWHTYFWLSFLPLILLLLVGTKLEHIITVMAQDVAERKDAPPKLSDEHFWFDKPHIVLYLIHFILFQNSFEIAFFFWVLSTYGLHSCMMEKIGYIVTRLLIGVLIQVLCSYSTLPLYAIVTQMGSRFKREIFDVALQDTIHGWAEDARQKKRTSSSSWGIRGRKSKHDSSSSSAGAVQMQTMTVEAVDSAHIAHHTIDLSSITTVNERSDSYVSEI